ncbi:hypothetical protein HK101_010565 [Irineochytrium annulatum]|nr:hypothetical protein HK101_010565 [Irineochytrium annulatum]
MGGIYEPSPCYPGFFCPNATTILPCPKGHYCVAGTVSPRACAPFSSCPEGSVLQQHYGLLLLVLVLDALLALFFVVRRIVRIRRDGMSIAALLPSFMQRGRRRSMAKKVDGESGSGDAKEAVTVEMHDTGASEADLRQDQRVGKLVDNFAKAFGGDLTLRMNFSFSDLGLTLPNGVSVLSSVSGEIKAGRMTAIMGPSGAGKTTFMNVLMGKAARTRGDITINGEVTEMRHHKKIIGYVAQDDVMLKELTVRENIRYAARVRLPRDWTNAEVDKHVDDVIAALNLTHVANNQIGDELTRGISGGQRKRVNIGIELASAPLSLFLDEPTSGLDATSALDLARLLGRVARLGLTVVSVIHQPRVEVFDCFDDVLLIAPGGRTAYFGDRAGARPYFEALGFRFDDGLNVADNLMDILSGRGVTVNGSPSITPLEIVTLWEKREVASSPASTTTKTSSADAATTAKLASLVRRRGATFPRQLLLSHNRSITQQLRFPGALSLEMFVALFAGAIMGFSAHISSGYVGILPAPYSLVSSSPIHWVIALYGMLVGISISLAGAPSGVKVFGEEKAVYWREAAAGHDALAYYAGKTAGVLARILLASLHFASVYLFLGRFPVPVGSQYALVALNFFCVYGMAAVVSMLVRRENASLLAVVVGLFSAVFCGFGLVVSASPLVYLLFDTGGNRWAAEAQYGMWLEDFQGVYDLAPALHFTGYAMGRTGVDIAAMVTVGVAYRIIGYVLLVSLHRDKQR